MTGAIVICIGNPFRRDDGVASAVAECLRPRVPDGATVVELDGEPARLVEAWADAELAVIVDAARSGARPGHIRRIEVDAGVAVPAGSRASTHGQSVGDALELGRALDRMPVRLVIHAVEGADFGAGPGLTAAVAAAVPDVVAGVLDELAGALAAGPEPRGRAG